MHGKRERLFVTALERLGARDVDDVSITGVIQGHIYRVLEACVGSRTVAAVVLGMHRRTLQRILLNGSVRLHKSGFSRPDPQTGLSKVTGEFSMPRLSALEYRLNEVIKQAVQQTAEIVRAEVAAEVQRAIGAVGAGVAKGARPAKRPPVTEASRSVRVGTKSSARSFPPHCVYPGCTKAQKGPRFSFLCAEHVGISKAEKKQYLDEWKATQKGSGPSNGASAKAATKPATKKKAPSAAPAGRQRGVDEATLARVLKVIEESPGLRSEQIYAKLPIETELARKALTKLRDTKRVKTKGEKRAMTYAA
jgi:hypothetical protein